MVAAMAHGRILVWVIVLLICNDSLTPLICRFEALLVSFLTAEGDSRAFLAEALPALVAEHAYWTSGPRAVRLAVPATATIAVSAAAGSGGTGTSAAASAATGAATGGGRGSSSSDMQPASASNLAASGAARSATQVSSSSDGGGDGDASFVTLSRYYADWEEPRPESYREDATLAENLSDDPSSAETDEMRAQLRMCSQKRLYRELASAAASGWDFSSRWMADGVTLGATRTTQTIPADLNALLYLLEVNISRFAAALGDDGTARCFAAAAAARLAVINAVLWDTLSGMWRDAVLDGTGTGAPAAAGSSSAASGAATAPVPAAAGAGSSSATSTGASSSCETADRVRGWRRAPGVFASSWVPLCCGCAPAGGPQAAAAVASLQASGLIMPAGKMSYSHSRLHRYIYGCRHIMSCSLVALL